MKKTTGIIIPCYNEYDRLEQDKFINFLKEKSNYHLCFVNDGSTDDTSAALHQLSELNPKNISVIDLELNQGKAGAVQSGANYLKTLHHIDNIAFLDADLSTSLEEMHNLVEKLNANPELAMVFGSRKMDTSKNIKRSNLRHLLSSFMAFFINFVLQLPIKDTQCGAKVFRKDVIQNIYTKKFISKWLFDIEIFLRLKKHIGINDLLNHISEEPLDSWIEIEGSKITLKDSFLIPINLILIWMNYITVKSRTKPTTTIINLETNSNMV
ncbi:hypothetical protein GCM10022393_24330 [Aquimarina addita]|uniref:dolichyl-phosphate beta-glucosyltransferase n=1 Tax=Aquimarina addita TaxID=870485 RepID=A0ABP6UMR5_9FLAO